MNDWVSNAISIVAALLVVAILVVAFLSYRAAQ
jgi:hypothetical protein